MQDDDDIEIVSLKWSSRTKKMSIAVSDVEYVFAARLVLTIEFNFRNTRFMMGNVECRGWLLWLEEWLRHVWKKYKREKCRTLRGEEIASFWLNELSHHSLNLSTSLFHFPLELWRSTFSKCFNEQCWRTIWGERNHSNLRTGTAMGMASLVRLERESSVIRWCINGEKIEKRRNNVHIRDLLRS